MACSSVKRQPISEFFACRRDDKLPQWYVKLITTFPLSCSCWILAVNDSCYDTNVGWGSKNGCKKDFHVNSFERIFLCWQPIWPLSHVVTNQEHCIENWQFCCHINKPEAQTNEEYRKLWTKIRLHQTLRFTKMSEQMFRKRNKNSLSLVYVPHKAWMRHFHVVVVQWRRRNVQ